MKKNWTEMFTGRVIGPLVIGHIIGGIGYIFVIDPMIWIGIGLIGYGFFLMIKEVI